MNKEEIELFNNLCNVMIYHFADVAHTEGDEDSASQAALIKEGIMKDEEDTEGVLKEYNNCVENWAQDHLTTDHGVDWDYWGGRCMKRERESTKNASLPFAGDNSGYFMLFDCFEAMKQYTEELPEDRKR